MSAKRLVWVAALALAGCGGTGDEPAGPGAAAQRALGSVMGLAARLSGPGPTLARPDAALYTPEAIAANTGAYRLVEITSMGLGEGALLVESHDAGGARVETYQLASGPTLTFRDGILAATRGLPEDLTTIDAPGLPAAIRAGQGAVTRRMEWLTAQDRIETDALACTVSEAAREEIVTATATVRARRIDEHCEGERVIFDNVYWLDDAGRIVSSQQFVSVSVTYLRASRV